MPDSIILRMRLKFQNLHKKEMLFTKKLFFYQIKRKTPLTFASSYGHNEIVRLLLLFPGIDKQLIAK